MTKPQAQRERQPVFQSAPQPQEIRSLSDFVSDFWWLYKTGIQGGQSTGWPSVDEFFRPRAREWTLVTGIPGHGKSTWIDNLMINMSVKHGWRWGVFSAENWPLERHAATLAAQYIGKPFGEGLRERITEEEFQKAAGFIDYHFKFICPREDNTTLDRILELADMIAKGLDPWRSSMNAMVIDPWNELDHSRAPNMVMTEFVSRALSKLRRFVREHEIHGFLIAHPTKLQRQKSGNGDEATIYPVPTPYDVSDSAHFRNKADCCISVWRNTAEDTSPTEIHVQKIRFRETGRIGMCKLNFDRATGRYLDLKKTIDDYVPPTREPGEEG